MAEHVEAVAGGEGPGVHEGEPGPLLPGGPGVVARQDAALPCLAVLGTTPDRLGQRGGGRPAEIERGDEPAGGEPKDPGAVAEQPLRVGRLEHGHALRCQRPHSLRMSRRQAGSREQQSEYRQRFQPAETLESEPRPQDAARGGHEELRGAWSGHHGRHGGSVCPVGRRSVGSICSYTSGGNASQSVAGTVPSAGRGWTPSKRNRCRAAALPARM